jgi:oxidase EvaA
MGVSTIHHDFLESALALDGITSRREIAQWVGERRNAHRFEVCRKSLSHLNGWHFEDDTGDLAHKSNKFFRIEGIEVTTSFGPTNRWMQPIINQPEIGILGFLTQKIDGVLHFLAQAKMEPGNINLLQISPTVQATRSNYKGVHGGSRPLYLDYFLDRSVTRVRVDQLQSEQGSRFLRKRNRNKIVEAPPEHAVPEHPDFRWMTLGQLFDCLRADNLVNMDSRTVLSCVPFSAGRFAAGLKNAVRPSVAETFSQLVFESALGDLDDNAASTGIDDIISWLTWVKTEYELVVRRVPLKMLEGWVNDGDVVRHRSNKFFSVIGVSVASTSREVERWDQPLIDSAPGGIIAFLCQLRDGRLHFLIQGRVEPGNLDLIEMAPTLQCTPENYNPDRPELLPPFYGLIVNAQPEQIRYSATHSEEGGRFYHDENRYLVVELDSSTNLNLPPNYIWMTIRQIKEFIRFNNYFNIEARGLVSCLGLELPLCA